MKEMKYVRVNVKKKTMRIRHVTTIAIGIDYCFSRHINSNEENIKYKK